MTGTTRIFAHDTETALLSAAALVNTDGRSGETLADPAALDAFVSEWGWTGSRTRDAGELDAVRQLRPVLRNLWERDEEGIVELTNELLRRHSALPQLVRHDEWSWHLHATGSDAPLADRMAVEAAMAFVDVVRQGELGRLRRCGAPGCGDVMVDLSRNSSKRYCSATCSNRVNVAAFRTRRASS
jgi:predicted RNA-binding Zn ribbon-like protein